MCLEINLKISVSFVLNIMIFGNYYPEEMCLQTPRTAHFCTGSLYNCFNTFLIYILFTLTDS